MNNKNDFLMNLITFGSILIISVLFCILAIKTHHRNNSFKNEIEKIVMYNGDYCYTIDNTYGRPIGISCLKLNKE